MNRMKMERTDSLESGVSFFDKFSPLSDHARERGGRCDSGYSSIYSRQRTSQINLELSNNSGDTASTGDSSQTSPHHLSTTESCPTLYKAEIKAKSLASLANALGFLDQCNKERDDTQIKQENTGEENVSRCHSVKRIQEELEEKSMTSKHCDQFADEGGDEGFCVAVSLRDGLVQHTTAFLTKVLGYPKDMWLGRSFLDFVHLEDREALTMYVAESLDTAYIGGKDQKRSVLFARIRIYNGLRSGFSVKGRRTRYTPFKLSVFFREESNSQEQLVPYNTFLFITAVPILPAYSVPLEVGPVKVSETQSSFSTKHRANCNLIWLDDWMLSYTGYLPQDLIGHSILEFIHSKDLLVIKDIFIGILTQQEKSCKTEGIRMRIKNGSYIVINSTWNSFVNPWSRNLEFVMGKHTVGLGPEVIDDFFNESQDPEVLKGLTITGQNIQDEIKKCSIMTSPNPDMKTQCRATTSNIALEDERKEEVEKFMVSLLDKARESFASPYLGPTTTTVLSTMTNSKTITNSKALISSDSDSPPNYVQLNYKENMTRYFNSQPRTNSINTTKEYFFPGEDLTARKQTKENNLKPGQRKKIIAKRKISSLTGSDPGPPPVQRDSLASSSQDDLSIGQIVMDDGLYSHPGREGSMSPSSDQYKAPVLTEELMALHNKDMEKKMKVQFKEAKKTGDTRFMENAAQRRQMEAALVTGKSTTPTNLDLKKPAVLGPASDVLLVYPGMPGQQPRSVNKSVLGSNEIRDSGCLVALPEDSDSSDLYSYLHTSSDMMTLPSSGEDNRKIMDKPRPTLKEPFWNLQVNLSSDLNLKYQMPYVELNEVLRMDKSKLEKMIQPPDMECQLEELMGQQDQDGVDMEEFLQHLILRCPPDEEDTEVGSSNEEQKTKKSTCRQNYLEKMSMFMEADDPLPDPDHHRTWGRHHQTMSSGPDINTELSRKKFKTEPVFDYSTSVITGQ